MQTKFIEKEIIYTGKELAPHWIYKKFGLQGDAIVAFTGEADVKITDMADIEDVIKNTPIYSKKMLHIIVEHFNLNLVEGVLRQRILVVLLKELLESRGFVAKRCGDDLFVEDKKLTVSIATKSPTSVLIHLGINIIAEGALVKACGLGDDFNITDIKKFAQELIDSYKDEIFWVNRAATKVRGVN